MVLIAESVRLQQLLATYGIQTQTPHQIEPIQIWPPVELAKAYEQLGVNDKLGLSGRPPRPIGGLGTAKVRCLLCTKSLIHIEQLYSAPLRKLFKGIISCLLKNVLSNFEYISHCVCLTFYVFISQSHIPYVTDNLFLYLQCLSSVCLFSLFVI